MLKDTVSRIDDLTTTEKTVSRIRAYVKNRNYKYTVYSKARTYHNISDNNQYSQVRR